MVGGGEGGKENLVAGRGKGRDMLKNLDEKEKSSNSWKMIAGWMRLDPRFQASE